MAEAIIPVDLLNPGQVFACLGFVEAADILLGDSLGRFAWDGQGGDTFALSAKGEKNPVGAVLEFLKEAKISKLYLGELANDTEKYCPIPLDEKKKAQWPATMKYTGHEKYAGREIVLDHWGDSGTGRDNMKFWAGMRRGHKLLEGACKLLDDLDVKGDCIGNPFAEYKIWNSIFKLDLRGGYVPLDAGFSPNEHNNRIKMVVFPVVEILAAVGLSHARATKETRLEYIYGVLSAEEAVPALFLRAALTGIESPIPGASFRRFRMTLGRPGKELCIRDVQEL